MWLGDMSVGADGTVIDDGSISLAPAPAPTDASSSPLIRLAADLADAIHPYKAGVPVTFSLSPQTQNLVMMGGLLVGGLLVLNMIRR